MLRKPLVLLLMILLCVLPAGCGEGDGTPSPVPSGNPAPVAGGDPIVIIYPVSGEDTRKELFPHLARLLGNRGWNISFESQPVEYSDGGLLIADAVKADVSAGIAADGYLMQTASARQLLKDGTVWDLPPTLQTAAPALYSAYRPFFDQCPGGLPTSILRYVKDRPLAFFLRADLAKGRQITAMGDVMQLLRDNPDATIAASGALWSMEMASVYDGWAGQQGYYPLDFYGITGGFYAAMDDETCAPVPVEKLPGFEDFYREAVGYTLDHRIVALWDRERLAKPSILGYVGRLDVEMDLNYLAARQESGEDYTAYLLAGGGVPVLPADRPDVFGVVAVPVSSDKAAPLAAFVQWVLVDDGGFDLMSYGEPDRDYRLIDGRVEYLNEGKPATLASWEQWMRDYSMKGLGQLFFLDDGKRPTVYSARNYESLQLLSAANPPIWRIERLRIQWHRCMELFMDIMQAQGDLISDRDMLLRGVIPGTSSENSPILEQCLKRLREMEQRTTELAEAYQKRIRELEEQGE